MKLLVLDGNSIVNRAFYGIKLLTTKSGEFTNGIVGFLNILEKLKEETQPDAVAVAFDMRAPTFRHKAFAGYKAQRKGMPPELAAQMPLLKELLQDLGYRIVTCEGWEADDILGTFARACEEKGDTCMIATGDRDSLQLVSPQTTVRLATTKFGQSAVTVYDEAKIREDYGVSPKQLIDIKAIQGDTSDNIPGVAGIGEKGAGELIRKFGSLQYIYDNLETLDIKPGMRAKLEASRDNAFLSYDLGTIRRNAPIDTALADYVPTAGDPAAGRRADDAARAVQADGAAAHHARRCGAEGGGRRSGGSAARARIRGRRGGPCPVRGPGRSVLPAEVERRRARKALHLRQVRRRDGDRRGPRGRRVPARVPFEPGDPEIHVGRQAAAPRGAAARQTA